VTKILPKSPRLKLEPKDYSALHRQVLERDNWRCQACGSMRNLEVHHIQFRSHSGSDLEQNLLTLCASCHKLSHGQRKIWPDEALYENPG
jgi:5-methylcytosine-specific restriction endonuclease McrA